MERRATVKFQGEELEEWEALLEVERRKLKEDMEVWRHNNKIKSIQITQRTQTERQTRKQRLARLESEVAADKLLYPEPPAIRNEGGALKWQRARAKTAVFIQERGCYFLRLRLYSESWLRAGNPGRDSRKTDRTEISILAPIP